VTTLYARARLTRTRMLSATSAPTVPTGIDLWLGRDSVVQAPADGEVLAAAPGSIDLTYGPHVLSLSFAHDLRPLVPAGAAVQAGEDLVHLGAGAKFHITLRVADRPAIPRTVRPEYAAGWLALTADPGLLLGLPASDDAPGDRDLLDRRDAAFATVQGHYYTDPPRIERGWRHHLLSAEGRSYLDIVNNVTPLGHAHPRIEQATSGQLRRLNTNSRFHYASVVEFSERLAGLLPAPLDTVFLVNSGSEAVDLGLRLAIGTAARTPSATGRRPPR
ncbi:aminotransferase class III-fold pyridoxal phosphate-dependent enzyme, partial [Streptomyces sp. NPDC058867]|uniref:aminotransferase class III-fold pyridoxal phosphate-dependent enzyme n=1 Tax=unclassified Streptomyces TaxID=2593676 RepID=UPI003681E959